MRDDRPTRLDDLEARLKEAARHLHPERLVDDLELRHLVRVVTGCSLIHSDVYSPERLARILTPDRTLLSAIVGGLIEEERRGGGEVLFRIRRLPDDVRVVGDKALFDLGILGLKRVKGYDLCDLGARAYRAAGESLELLSEDRRLRDFFRQNRLLMLPLEEEVGFLRQCSEKFPMYAEILRLLHRSSDVDGAGEEDLATRVPLMAAVESALMETDAYVAAAIDGPTPAEPPKKDETISLYERMLLFSSLDLEHLRGALRAVVVDQDAAVDTLCDEFSLYASGTRDLRKPPAYFLVGPTGVGKNHLVESLARALGGIWGAEIPFLTIEGPNYTYPSDINELRGATRGFIRSDEDGILTAFHERSSRAPFAVILVDEVEKAHPQLRTFFLSILDRGTTTDNRGRTLQFANTMIFFTSNIGYSDAQQRSTSIGFQEDEARAAAADRDVRRDLRRALSPEFMNRLRIVHFDRLTRSSAERILDLEVERIARRYREVQGLEIELAPSAKEELLRRGFSAEFGARRLAATLESVVNVELSKVVKRDDSRQPEDRAPLLAWLRELRDGTRAYDAEAVRRRVLEAVRAKLDYDTIRIVLEDGAFAYQPLRRKGA